MSWSSSRGRQWSATRVVPPTASRRRSENLLWFVESEAHCAARELERDAPRFRRTFACPSLRQRLPEQSELVDAPQG